MHVQPLYAAYSGFRKSAEIRWSGKAAVYSLGNLSPITESLQQYIMTKYKAGTLLLYTCISLHELT